MKRKPAKAAKSSRKSAKFIDLGDDAMEMPSISNTSKPKKYYPSIRMRKSGIKTNIGKIGTALVKFKVRGIELRDGQPPETNIELQGIQEQE